MIGVLAEGAVAGYGVALPIGAIGTYLVGLGARAPFATAAAAALGVATTDGLFAIVATVGGSGLQRVLRSSATGLAYVGAAVLVGLAARTVHAALRRHRRPEAEAEFGTPSRPYLRMLVLTASNPSTIIYFGTLAAAGGAGGSGRQVGPTVLFATGAFAASASWQLVLAGSGVALGRVLRGPRGQLAIALLSGAIMVGLAARLATG